ncbi:hypothetical protein [Pseudomonas oryzihabitans]|uniref:hypothetical protein n=1 Tax=Pseudomonas oryzihabitans TaxID=47885 RepID=UPI0028942FA3|nr:hypothetical protein [Pseudomonas oryzihabitans]MDT3723268.1 hypothetical protein [Pseudomonas oryzihabitans]
MIVPQVDYEPFAGIIRRALQALGTAEGDLAHDPRYLAPADVVRMFAALAQAATERSGRDVPLDNVIRLERTCTGADYHHKLALRCAQLAG